MDSQTQGSSSFYHPAPGLQMCSARPGFYVGAGDPNSGLHACIASNLPPYSRLKLEVLFSVYSRGSGTGHAFLLSCSLSTQWGSSKEDSCPLRRRLLVEEGGKGLGVMTSHRTGGRMAGNCALCRDKLHRGLWAPNSVLFLH